MDGTESNMTIDQVHADTNLMRLMQAGLHGIWVVNPAVISLSDLAHAKPGTIIPCADVSQIRFIPTDSHGLEGCIAGWISDDDDCNGRSEH